MKEVFVVTENDRDLLEAWYKRNKIGENTDERIEFLKKRLSMLFYGSKKGYTKERHLAALERTALLDVF